MGTSNSKKKKKEEKVSCLVKSLHKFLRKGTFHLETQREDSLGKRNDGLFGTDVITVLFSFQPMKC
jgi:hypothetical protein